MATAQDKTPQPTANEERSSSSAFSSDDDLSLEGGVNVSGHKQELQHNFDLLNLIGLGITLGYVWITLGSAIVCHGTPESELLLTLPRKQNIAIYNGGPTPPASSTNSSPPGSSTVLLPPQSLSWHWRSPRRVEVRLAWARRPTATDIDGDAKKENSIPLGNSHGRPIRTLLRLQWHVFLTYIIFCWICVLISLYMNRVLPSIEMIGGFTVIAGVFLSILACAVMPHVNNRPYASSFSVRGDWQNQTGYSGSGFAFLQGMLNGAFSIGTPDLTSYLAEEVPTQYVFGLFSGFFYLLAILYGISDLTAVLESSYLFPLAEIYRQVAGAKAGSVDLLFLAFLPTFISCVGCLITASRVFWTLARDRATPFSHLFSRIDHGQHNPFRTIVFCGIFATVLGCIYVGSTTAFSAFVGSFVILSTLSYVTAILPHLHSKRKHVVPGWFWMKGASGFIVNGIACVYIIVFIVIFCFPFSLPVDAASMNYASVITGGLSLFLLAFWFVRQGTYVGPKQVVLGAHVLAKDAI
ncbi:MAG: hypothetical protein Q9173_007279 [Seirophora scorigena]